MSGDINIHMGSPMMFTPKNTNTIITEMTSKAWPVRRIKNESM
jgi:hypothetical protein